jgi:ADP-ribose pyrophosphatase YjhB (NUDIX family)
VKTLLAKTWRTLSLPKSVQLAVMRLFQDQFLIGVTGVIFDDKDEVLLFRHTYRSTQWSLPGGYIKAKEHPFEGLEREIQEESGLVVSVDSEHRIRADRESSRLDITLLGTYIGGDFKPSSEVIEYGFFSIDNLPQISKNQLLLIHKAIKERTQLH